MKPKFWMIVGVVCLFSWGPSTYATEQGAPAVRIDGDFVGLDHVSSINVPVPGARHSNTFGDDVGVQAFAMAPRERPEASMFKDSWTKDEKKTVKKIVDDIKDENLKNWCNPEPASDTKAKLKRFAPDGVSPISVSGDMLRVKDDFFDISDSRRENLFLFESGKVFFHLFQNAETQPGGETFMTWLSNFTFKYEPILSDMKAAKKPKGESLSDDNYRIGDMLDYHSQTGHVLRTVALGLERPAAGGTTPDQWTEAVTEAKTRIAYVLAHAPPGK